MDVVRPQFRAATERGGHQERAATLEPADLDHRAAVDIPSQPVEQGGLVELLRDDAVVQLAAREEEGEILEPTGLVRPPPCGRETELTRVADRRGEQCRAARFRPAQTADERLDPASHEEETVTGAQRSSARARAPGTSPGRRRRRLASCELPQV